MAELYLFKNGTIYNGFSPSILNKTFNGREYIATAIIRSKLVLTSNYEKSAIDFTFPKNNVFAKDMLLNLPENPVEVTIYKDGIVYWLGKIIDTKANPTSIILSCDSEQFTLARKGLTARMSPECRHTLYSPNCGVNKLLFKTDFSNITPTSINITVSGLSSPNGTYDNGIAEFEGQSRRIVKQVGSLITLHHAFTLPVGTSGTLSIYPGCNLTETDCKNKFNNLLNNGSFSRMAHINPFSSTGML